MAKKDERRKESEPEKLRHDLNEIKSELKKLGDDINEANKKIMLNERDTLLLSLATSLGVIFSVIQIFKGSWEAYFPFVILLAFGFVMPLVKYFNRIRRKLPLYESLIEHFESWDYFSFAFIGYIIISLVSFGIIENSLLIAVISLISILSIAWILNFRATGFYRLFEHEKPDGFLGTFLKGFYVILRMLLIFLAIIFIYLIYIFHHHQLEVPPLLYIAVILFVLIAILIPLKKMGRCQKIIIAIIVAIAVIFGLSFFVMPITSVSISENIEMSENLVIEASGFYLSPLPRLFNCAEVYYTISWWNDNEGEWMKVFEKPMAECSFSCFYLDKDYQLTWSPEEDGWGWWRIEKENDALPGHYKIDITVLGDDYEFEFDLIQGE